MWDCMYWMCGGSIAGAFGSRPTHRGPPPIYTPVDFSLLLFLFLSPSTGQRLFPWMEIRRWIKRGEKKGGSKEPEEEETDRLCDGFLADYIDIDLFEKRWVQSKGISYFFFSSSSFSSTSSSFISIQTKQAPKFRRLFLFLFGQSAFLLFLLRLGRRKLLCKSLHRQSKEIGNWGILSLSLVSLGRRRSCSCMRFFLAFHTHLDWSPPSIPCWPIDFPARREERPNPQRIGERCCCWCGCAHQHSIYKYIFISVEEDLRYVCVVWLVSQPKQAHTTQTRWSSTFIGLRFLFLFLFFLWSHSYSGTGRENYMPTKSRTRE